MVFLGDAGAKLGQGGRILEEGTCTDKQTMILNENL